MSANRTRAYYTKLSNYHRKFEYTQYIGYSLSKSTAPGTELESGDFSGLTFSITFLNFYFYFPEYWYIPKLCFHFAVFPPVLREKNLKLQTDFIIRFPIQLPSEKQSAKDITQVFFSLVFDIWNFRTSLELLFFS